jgi:transcriptional regulator with XRE-family HTH domain
MNYDDIGNFLRMLRERKKLSQETVAAIIGISDRTLRNIENGLTRAELNTIFKLCDLYGISGEEIWFFYNRDVEMQEALNIYDI